MRSGKLDRRIVIEVRSATKNGVGEEVITWTTLVTIWAERVPQSVTQKFNTQQLYAEVDTIFRTRWFPQGHLLDPLDHRVKYRDRVYDIHGTHEIGRRDGVMILTKARLDNEAGTT